MKLVRMMAATMLLIGSIGCDLLTGPKPLIDQFTWELVDNQDGFNEGVSIAAIFGDINFLGQALTPTLCYDASSDLETDDNTITIHINIASSRSGTCAQQAGGVRYAGSVLNLDQGTYTVRIIQTVTGVGTQEFTQEVKL